GCPGGGVPDEAGDLRDADAAVAHQADEGGAQLARRPAVPDPGLGADALEHLPDVPRVQRGTQVAGEHQPGVLPVVPGREPLTGLEAGPGTEREYCRCGEAEGAAGSFGLGI